MASPSPPAPTPCFNGGKMQHIFAFNGETRKYETDGRFTSPEAQEALLHGVLYYKIDGSNGMVQVIRPNTNANTNANTIASSGDGGDDSAVVTEEPVVLKIYQRMDTKGKKPNGNDDNTPALLPLPNGKNASEYPGHSYYYSEIVTENVHGKKLIKRNRAMRELVERHRDKFMAYGQDEEWISVEWIGTMFNKTPNVPHPIAVAIHREQRVDVAEDSDSGVNVVQTSDNAGEENKDTTTTTQNAANGDTDNQQQTGTNTIERTYDGMRKYFLEDCAEQPLEGLIIEHQGVYWKVRSDCFFLPKGTQDPFKKNRENSRPPVFLV